MKETDSTLRKYIRSIPDYPKKGIVFRDITPLLKDPIAFGSAIDAICDTVSGIDFDYVVGIEARGFLIGSIVAYKMHKGFVPLRKRGKLPFEKVTVEYQLEYGIEAVEMHKDAIEKGSRVLVVDDLLATGGTAKAANDIVKSLGGVVTGYAFLIELVDLKGRERLSGNVFSILKF